MISTHPAKRGRCLYEKMTYIRESLPDVTPYEGVRLDVEGTRVALVYGCSPRPRMLTGVRCSRVFVVVMEVPVSGIKL